jgi:hypothetical protein
MSAMHRLFVHCFRHNKHESICRSCFMTVSSQKSESELAIAEQLHICNADHLWSRLTYVGILKTSSNSRLDSHLKHKV